MKFTLLRSIAPAVALVAAAVVVGGCGSDDKSASVPAPLENALAYLPQDAAVLAVVPTDTGAGPIKQLDDLASAEVKGWDKIKSQIKREIDSDSSIPGELDALLGNPIAVAQSGPDSDDQYIALQVQNAATVKQAAEADISKGDARELPEYDGAFLWEDTDDDSEDSDDDETNFNALKGNVIVAASSEELLKQALDNAGGDDNMSSNDDFKSKLNELGGGSLTRVVGDAQQLIANADDSEDAEKIKFVKALGMFYGKTTVTSTGLQSESTLETDNESLSEDERPLPAGGAQLTLPEGEALAGVALSDPDHIVKFAESVFKQTNAQEFGQYELGLEQLKSTGGVDLHVDLLAQMEQLSVTALRGENFEFQAKLKDGQMVQESLTKAQTFLQSAIGGIEGGLTLSIEGSSSSPTYVVTRGRDEVARFAVKDDALVGSIGPSGTLPSPTASTPIEGATGALGLQVDLTRITELPGVEDEIDDQLALDVLESLGTVRQSVTETEDAITEKSTLTLE